MALTFEQFTQWVSDPISAVTILQRYHAFPGISGGLYRVSELPIYQPFVAIARILNKSFNQGILLYDQRATDWARSYHGHMKNWSSLFGFKPEDLADMFPGINQASNYTFPMGYMAKFLGNFDLTAHNLVVAGGFLSSLLTGPQPPKDMDLFIVLDAALSDQETIRQMEASIAALITHLSRTDGTFKLLKVYRSAKVVTLVTEALVFQIILRCYSSIEEILFGFDLGPAQLAYDGNHFLATPMGYYALFTGLFLIDPEKHYQPAFNSRVIKYLSRGFIGVLPCAIIPDGTLYYQDGDNTDKIISSLVDKSGYPIYLNMQTDPSSSMVGNYASFKLGPFQIRARLHKADGARAMIFSLSSCYLADGDSVYSGYNPDDLDFRNERSISRHNRKHLLEISHLSSATINPNMTVVSLVEELLITDSEGKVVLSPLDGDFDREFALDRSERTLSLFVGKEAAATLWQSGSLFVEGSIAKAIADYQRQLEPWLQLDRSITLQTINDGANLFRTLDGKPGGMPEAEWYTIENYDHRAAEALRKASLPCLKQADEDETIPWSIPEKQD